MFIKSKQILITHWFLGKKKEKTENDTGGKNREKFRTNKKQHCFSGFEVKQELSAGCYKTERHSKREPLS